MSKGDFKCNEDPAHQNCKFHDVSIEEKTVLPVPDVPLTRVLRDTGSPPLQTSSKPSIPVGNFELAFYLICQISYLS